MRMQQQRNRKAVPIVRPAMSEARVVATVIIVVITVAKIVATAAKLVVIKHQVKVGAQQQKPHPLPKLQ